MHRKYLSKFSLHISFLSFKFLFLIHLLSDQTGHAIVLHENFFDIIHLLGTTPTHTFNNKCNSDKFYFALTMACLLGGTLLRAVGLLRLISHTNAVILMTSVTTFRIHQWKSPSRPQQLKHTRCFLALFLP